MGPFTLAPLLVVALAQAAPPAPARDTLVVDFVAADAHDPDARWFARALEQRLIEELSRFQRVAIADKIRVEACPGREPACLLSAYAGRANVLVLGRLAGEQLHYEAYETWTRTSVFRGTLALGPGVTSGRLQHLMGAIVLPIVQSGGLLDRRPTHAPPPSTPGPAQLRAVLAHPAANLLVHLLGGALWATFMLVCLGFALPPLHGLGRIRQRSVWPLLRAWLVVAALRLCCLLAFLPLAAAAHALGRSLGLEPATTSNLLVPACGLVVWLSLFALAEGLARRLDRRLIAGPPAAANPWHRAARKYFVGYVRRLGIHLPPKLLDRVLFLPSTRPGLCSYGSRAAPRIAIDTALLELALGPLPDEDDQDDAKEDATPDRPATINLEEMPLGLVLPRAGQASAPRMTAAGEKMRSLAAGLPARARGRAPRLIGRNSTRLGWVLPSARNQAVPLIANTRDDFEVVHGLLTAHYAAFLSEDDDGEHDDTDPTQKDFLFGAMLRELGSVRRQESRWTTFTLALQVWNPKALAPVGRWLHALYRRFASQPGAAVADAYAALNFAADHLVQYLHHARTGQAAHLTARADAVLLASTSRDILETTARETPAGPDRQVLRATLRNRLVSLSLFFDWPIPQEHARRVRRAAGLGAAAVVFALTGRAVMNAVDYHPRYLDRLKMLEARAAELQPGGANRGSP